MRYKTVLVILALLLGCDTGGDQPRSNSSHILNTAGVAYALGGKGDLSYNDAAAKGTDVLRARGVAVREFEPSSIDDYSRGIEALASTGVPLIYAVGYLYDDAVLRIAPLYPNSHFVVLDGSAVGPPNVTSVKFDAEEGSVFAGAVAGALTRSGKVAFIGGANIPIINEFLNGYRRGVHLTNPAVEVDAYYIGAGGQAFTDPVKGREVGMSAIRREADVLYHAAGLSGNGVIEAARDQGVLVIGVDVDQSFLAPGTVVTSMLKDFEVAMESTLRSAQAGTLSPGLHTLGARDGAVRLAPVAEPYVEQTRAAIDKAEVHLRSANAP